MATEPVTLRHVPGPPVSATAEVVRYPPADRLRRAAALVGAGIGLGALSILLPGLHLIATWLFPLLGLIVGAWVHGVVAHVGPVHAAACPSCGEAVAIDRVVSVGAEGRRVVRCPRCQRGLVLGLGGASSGPGAGADVTAS